MTDSQEIYGDTPGPLGGNADAKCGSGWEGSEVSADSAVSQLDGEKSPKELSSKRFFSITGRHELGP